MTDHDDHLERALHDLPTGDQRPLESIEARARTLRTRRRTAGGAVVALAAAVLAVPPITVLGGDEGATVASSSGGTSPESVTATLAPTPPSTPVPEKDECEPAPEGRGEFLSLDEVPDELRLLWGEWVAPSPTEAYAADNSVLAGAEACLVRPQLKLADVEDGSGEVSRTITMTVLPPSEPDAFGTPARVLETASRDITIVEQDGEHLHAWWPSADGAAALNLVAEPAVTDAELLELASSTTFTDGTLETDAWSGAEHIAGAGIQYAEDFGVSFIAHTESLRLSATTVPFDDIRTQAERGDRIVQANGELTLQRTYPGGEQAVLWMPGDGVLARLATRDGDVDRPMAIFATISPVAADDQRLVDAWQTPDS